MPVLESTGGVRLIYRGVGPQRVTFFDYIRDNLVLNFGCTKGDNEQSLVVHFNHAVNLAEIKRSEFRLSLEDEQDIKENLIEALPIWEVMQPPGAPAILNVLFV